MSLSYALFPFIDDNLSHSNTSLVTDILRRRKTFPYYIYPPSGPHLLSNSSLKLVSYSQWSSHSWMTKAMLQMVREEDKASNGA